MVLFQYLYTAKRGIPAHPQDKEEAAYLNIGSQNCFKQRTHMIFPSSFKKAYHCEKVDNANS